MTAASMLRDAVRVRAHLAALVDLLQADAWDQAATERLDQLVTDAAALLEQTNPAVEAAPEAAAAVEVADPIGRFLARAAELRDAESATRPSGPEPGDLRECRDCRVEKPFDSEHFQSRGNVLFAVCRDCFAAKQQAAAQRRRLARNRGDEPNRQTTSLPAGRPAGKARPIPPLDPGRDTPDTESRRPVRSDRFVDVEPLALSNPIVVTTSCAQHGRIDQEHHERTGDPDGIAEAARLVAEALHAPCAGPVTVSWETLERHLNPTVRPVVRGGDAA